LLTLGVEKKKKKTQNRMPMCSSFNHHSCLRKSSKGITLLHWWRPWRKERSQALSIESSILCEDFSLLFPLFFFLTIVK
jgi:hypothetical protein